MLFFVGFQHLLDRKSLGKIEGKIETIGEITMKLERLLAIVMKLLNKDQVTARELAEEFEVSVRTIQRDMDSINMAGIPIVSTKGVNGGYSIVKEFKIRNGFLKEDEHELLMTALNGVLKAYGDQQLQHIIDKLNVLKATSRQNKRSTIQLDFSGWGKAEKRSEKVQILKEAIESQRVVSFTYIDMNGNHSVRKVEPLTLLLKLNKWYVYAYCLLRNDFRLFKLGRMREVNVLQEKAATHVDIPSIPSYHQGGKEVTLTLKFSKHALNQLEDFFEFEDLQFGEDGLFYLTETFPEDEWIYRMLLSLGDEVEVLKPDHVRHMLKERAKKIYDLY